MVKGTDGARDWNVLIFRIKQLQLLGLEGEGTTHLRNIVNDLPDDKAQDIKTLESSVPLLGDPKSTEHNLTLCVPIPPQRFHLVHHSVYQTH
jgi:hypothetical protein